MVMGTVKGTAWDSGGATLEGLQRIANKFWGDVPGKNRNQIAESPDTVRATRSSRRGTAVEPPITNLESNRSARSASAPSVSPLPRCRHRLRKAARCKSSSRASAAAGFPAVAAEVFHSDLIFRATPVASRAYPYDLPGGS